MSGILDALNKGLRLLKHGDDDFFDRMSSRYTVALLVVFAVIVSTGKERVTLDGVANNCV